MSSWLSSTNAKDLGTLNLRSRYYHSSLVLNSDVDLEKRIKNLDLDNLNTGLEELKRLSNENKNKNNENENNDDRFDLISDNTLTPFDEAFPNLTNLVTETEDEIQNIEDNDFMNTLYNEYLPLYNSKKSIFKTVEFISHSESEKVKNILNRHGLFDSINKFKDQIIEENTDDIDGSEFKNVAESKFKPLGEYGEMTINESLLNMDKLIKPILNHVSDNSEKYSGVITAYTSVRLYKKVVEFYTNKAFPSKNKNYLGVDHIRNTKMRQRELIFFMIWGAPPIVGALLAGEYLIGKNLLSGLGDKSIDKNKDELEVIGSGSLIFSSNNKFSKWGKIIMLLIFLSYFLLRKFGYLDSIFIYSVFNIVLEWIKYPLLIGNIFCLIYFILSLILYILYSKNKISTPKYLPQFLLIWLNDLYEISKFEYKGWFIEYLLRNILIYFLILIGLIYVINLL